MPPSTDTIAAVATAPGAGAIGRALTGKRLRPRTLRLCALRDRAGAVLDHALTLSFAAPHSATGEDVLELHAHGSPVVLDLLLRRVFELGARPARPGEFSERAFLNGKLDLVQA